MLCILTSAVIWLCPCNIISYTVQFFYFFSSSKRFFKLQMGVTRNGGKARNGEVGRGWLYNGRDGKFSKSLYVVGRGVQTSLPHFPGTSNSHPQFILLSCFFGRMGDHCTSHTQTHTRHTQGPVDWHTHINTYLHHLLCAYSSYLYYTEWLNK